MSFDKFYLCSETHWDREWYGSFQQYRIRLVEMIDALIDIMEHDKNYKCFNFDGQTIVLEDYLEVRPEMEDTIKDLISSGRLVVGPWYILPDEFLVDGESTVRNLIFGSKVAKKYGDPSIFGYLPDTFGHFSQMPQILKQWGIKAAAFWRGISSFKYENELFWDSPDGSRIALSYIPEKCGYCNAALFVNSLPSKAKKAALANGMCGTDVLTGDDAVEAILEACEESRSNASTNVHLLLNGVDHMMANAEIPEIIRKANKRLNSGEIIHSSFNEYAKAFLEATSGKKLHIINGEARNTVWTKNSTAIILNGVLSSRIYLKQQNQHCCSLLESWIEPFSVLNSSLGGKYRKGLIDKAWQLVLKNHPHDSIGGCSVDEVHKQMETRFECASEIAENLLDFNFTEILENVKIEGLAEGEYAFAVFNPHQSTQSGWIRTELELPAYKTPKLIDSAFKGVVVSDMNGVEQKSWLHAFNTNKTVNRPSLRMLATAFQTHTFDVSLYVEDIPACGYKIFKFKPIAKPNCIFGDMVPERNVLENEHLRISINSNGTINITDKDTGFTYKNLHYFEDGGDNGGGYAYSFPKSDEIYTSLSANADISLIENSQARAAYKIGITLNLPESLDSTNQARTDRKTSLRIESVISLNPGSKRLDIETTLINTAKDHRLRVMFPTYLDAKISSAEAQFDVVDHPVFIKQPPLDVWKEDQPKQFPQKSFVSITDGIKGLSIANKGLPEYEITPDNERAVAITLLRAVAYLSTSWKNTRICEAGPIIETPEQQMIGRKLVFNYSIIPHSGTWHEANVQNEAHAYLSGLKAFPVIYNNCSEAILPPEFSMMSVDGKNIALSSVKLCEDGNGYAIRLWNGSDKDSNARINFSAPITTYLSNIKEKRLTQLSAGETVDIEVGAKKIVTIIGQIKH